MGCRAAKKCLGGGRGAERDVWWGGWGEQGSKAMFGRVGGRAAERCLVEGGGGGQGSREMFGWGGDSDLWGGGASANRVQGIWVGRR